MIDYSDPNDPNYDPYWEDEETGYSEPADCPDLSEIEIEELAAEYIREMRKDGLLRPVLIKPVADLSPFPQPDYELEHPF